MISVAMTCYNGEKYILEQLESIKNQKKEVDEVIICDDKSQDSTVQIVEKFIKDNNLNNWNLIENPENLGYVCNFLKAISLTTGDVIFLSDQDDVWCPNKVEVMCEYMQKYDFDMLYSGVNVVNEKLEVISKNHYRISHGLLVHELPSYMKGRSYPGMAMAFKEKIRDYISEMDLSKAPSHDWILGFITAEKARFATTNKILSLRRVHGDNVAYSDKKAKRDGVEERIEAIEGYLKYYEYVNENLDNLKVDYRNRVVVDRFVTVTRKRIECLKNRDWKAIGLIFKINYYPSFGAYICDLMYIFKLFGLFKRG